jgi:hypothetical protein
VGVDLKSYFDTIPHERLLSELRKYVADNRVIDLVAKFLKVEILDGQEHWEPESSDPQGAVRIPSEAQGLKWDHIAWEAKRISNAATMILAASSVQQPMLPRAPMVK